MATQTPTDMNQQRPNSLPKLGVLSKRLFHSPVIKAVLSARIRSEIRTDFVFIGTYHIEVRELKDSLQTTHTRHVATYDKFACAIRKAAVITRKSIHSEDIDNHAAASAPKEEVFVKQEDAVSEPDDTYPHEEPSVAIHRPGPRQALLLTMEDGTLIMITMKQVATHLWDYVISKPLPLPCPHPHTSSPAAELYQPGDLIAVHPESTAFAIAAPRQTLIIFETKVTAAPHPELKDIILRSTTRTLDRYTFLAMDFVKGDIPNEAQLVIATANHETCRHEILVYKWQLSHDNLTSLHHRATSYLSDHGFPYLIMPSQKFSGGFLLACDVALLACQVNETGHIEITFVEQNDRLIQKRDADSSGHFIRPPLWTAFGYSWVWKQDEEFMYLGREDGLLAHRRVQWDPSRKLFIASADVLGDKIVNAIGPAFMLPGWHHLRDKFASFDTVVVVGEYCDGGMFVIGGDTSKGEGLNRAQVLHPDIKEIYYNWAPFWDLISTSDEREDCSDCITNDQNSVPLMPRQGLVASTGRNESGSLSVIRFGCELPCRDKTALDETIATSIIPVFPVDSKDEAYVLSGPGCSELLHFDHESDQIFSRPLLARETLDAQILPSSVKQEDSSSLLPFYSPDIAMHLFQDIACITVVDGKLHDQDRMNLSTDVPGMYLGIVDASRSLVLCAIRQHGAALVSLKKFVVKSSSIGLIELGESISSELEPTALCFLVDGQLERSNSQPGFGYAAVGYAGDSVRLLRVSKDQGLSIVHEFHVGDSSRSLDLLDAVNSIAWMHLSVDSRQLRGAIVCGMRSGSLIVLEVIIDLASNHNVNIINRIERIAAHVPIRVKIDTTAQNSAFILGDDDPLHVQLHEGNLEINPIYLTDRGDRSWSSGPVLDLCQAQVASHSSGDLICIGAFGLVKGPFDCHPRPLPRQFLIDGTPSRLLYSRILNAIIASSTIVDYYVEEEKRYIFSRITVFMLPNDVADISQANLADLERAEYDCDPAEQVRCLCEWTYVDHTEVEGRPRKTQYHFLIAGTETTGTNASGGNVHLLKVGGRSEGELRIKSTKSIAETEPVRAICTFEDRHIVYCCGQKVCSMVYDNYRLERRKELFVLPSPGVSMSIEGSEVSITTVTNSVLVFRFDGATLHPRFADSKGRQGISHVVLKNPDVCLVACKSGDLTGMVYASQGDAELHLIEAKLPVPIAKLTKTSVRRPWKRKPVKGIRHRDIVGAAPNGSLYTFSLLDTGAWRLLRFIQNLQMESNSANSGNHIEPEDKDAKQWHIDGDVLARLTADDTGYEKLATMLDISSGSNGHVRGYDSPVIRRRRLEELVNEAFGPGCLGEDEIAVGCGIDEIQIADSGRRTIDRVLTFIKEVLDGPF